MVRFASEFSDISWVPHVSVNGFVFGEHFDDIACRVFLEFESIFEPNPCGIGEVANFYFDDIGLSFEDGVLSSVDFHERCQVHGSDLIGMPVSEAIQMLVEYAQPLVDKKIKVVMDEHVYALDPPEMCFDIDGTGVQVWSSAETGFVISLSFFKNDEDD